MTLGTFVSNSDSGTSDTPSLTMPTRHELLDDIQVLTALIERAEEHERNVDEADSLDAHIEAQVTRLEEAELKLERRVLELDSTGASEAEEQLYAAERQELLSKLSALRAKMELLRDTALENEVLDAAAHAARPEGLLDRLRRTLRVLVMDMHADPTVPKDKIRPFQLRLAKLVRERRDALSEIGERLADARDYMASAAEVMRTVSEGVRQIGDAPAEELPYADDRALASTRVEMARVAVRDALQELEELAHDWPRLDNLAQKPDWKKLPFGQTYDLISPRDRAAAQRIGTAPDRMEEAFEMCRAVALWLEELRKSVAEAPAPR